MSEQIFKARLELIQTFDAIHAHGDERAEVAGVLREAIASMNEKNFLVRPHLELVEKYRKGQAWESLSAGDLAALADRVAKLPVQLDPEHEDAKRFDMLLLNAQLGVLRSEPFERERHKVVAIAGALEDQQTIPVIAAQLELIQDVQSDEWWMDVSYPMLEEVRKKLRLLVPLIERSKKGVIYSVFGDEMTITKSAIPSSSSSARRQSTSSSNTSPMPPSPRSALVSHSPPATSPTSSASSSQRESATTNRSQKPARRPAASADSFAP